MPDRSAPLAVLGATGYTGRLVVETARGLGVPLRLVGRRPTALADLGLDGEEIRVADARDRAALEAAIDGAFALASSAGPFLETGSAPLQAALAAGAHYLDTSAEQAFARRVYEEFGPAAEQRGVAVLTSFGFDYVPGDLAARIAADGLEPVDEIAVGYATSGLALTTSRGTRRTMASVLARGHVAFADGRLVPSRFGATTRRLRFPAGEASAVEWSATEPLTVPRHTDVRSVRSYLRAPRVAALAGRVAPLLAPVARLAGAVGAAGPGERRRVASRFAVVAEARSAAGARRATLVGRDVYGLTALLLVRGAEALRDGAVRGAGALAPAEAFEARWLIERLAPLLELHSVEDF